MLKVSTEFRKGVLFVRLVGRIDNEGYIDKIKNLVEELGIQYIVLNLSGLLDVSLDSVEHIIKYNKLLKEKKKTLLICDASKVRERLFKNIIPNISNEIEAFSLQ